MSRKPENPCLPCAVLGNPGMRTFPVDVLPCETHIDMPYSHAHIDMPGAHAATAPGAITHEYAPHGEAEFDRNPLTRGERGRLRQSIEELEALETSGDCETRGYISGLRRCERQHNPSKSEAQRQLFALALAVKRGERSRSKVSATVRQLADTMSEQKLSDFASCVGACPKSARNPKSKLWGIWHKDGGCAKVRRVGDPDEARIARQGFRRVATDRSHDLADRVADELYGGRVGNPKLVVLNPSGGISAAAERRLGRRLTQAEGRQLAQAEREFKTFFGRNPTAADLVPVDVPPGTPIFVNMIGRADRTDYTVPNIGSSRDGRWTHRAGDHGGRKSTRPPFWVSIPGRKRHNYVLAQPKGSHTYFKPTHGIMG